MPTTNIRNLQKGAAEEEKGSIVGYGRNTNELEALIKQAVIGALVELGYTSPQDLKEAHSIFPLRTIRQVAKTFNVSHHTVRGWTRRGLLHSHYQILSGRSCRLIFTNSELLNFFDENFPSPEDFGDHPCNPRKGSKASRLIEKMFRMNRLYARQRRRVEEDGEG